MTSKENKAEERYLEINNPFIDPEQDAMVVDMTDHASISGKEVLRVELRKTSDPATASKRAEPSLRIPEKNYIIGLLSPEDLPQEGENFSLAYHSWNANVDFGTVDSFQPIRNLIQEDNCYYFETDEGQWRLKILNSGN